MSAINSGSIFQTHAPFQIDSNGCGPFLRCKFSVRGLLTVASATDNADMLSLGVIEPNGRGLFAFISGPGTRWGIASGAIADGSDIYSADGGKISAVRGDGHPIGKALSDATDGDPCLWIPRSESS
jgi:hypothetical protein